MPKAIHQAGVRRTLASRREPYWGSPLHKGRYLGVRKLADGTCIWIARLRNDEGKQKYNSLGQVTDSFDYNAAKGKAEEWFQEFDAGVTDKPITVSEACHEHADYLENVKNKLETARCRRVLFKKVIDGEPIGKVLVKDLKTKHIEHWRADIATQGAKAAATQKTYLQILRAALNRAVKAGRVSPGVASQWRNVEHVQQDEDAPGRRDVYLDLKQRRRLLSVCEGAFRDLVEAVMLTGCRPGELTNLKRSQFDARTGTVTYRGKTGSRKVALTPRQLELFNRLAKNKLPDAYVLLQDDGRPWQRWDWDDLMRNARRAAKLPEKTVLYSLRHSFITEAISSGKISVSDVAQLTGTSIAMIDKHYGHLAADAARDRLAQVELL